MKTDSTKALDYGFTLTVKDAGKVLDADKGLDLIEQIHRLESVASNVSLHHHYCTRLLDIFDKTRAVFSEIGQSVKITSPVPISAIRYAPVSNPTAMVYRFVNSIFHRGQCSFDHTTAWKLKDFFRSEFKSIFNVTYELELDEDNNPVMKRRVYPTTNQINDVIKTVKEVDHPAFVLQAIKGIAPLEVDKKVNGRFFETTLNLKAGGNFTILLKSNKPSGDSVQLTYEEGRFHVTLLQSVLKVNMDVTDQLLFEIMYCLQCECQHGTRLQQTMKQLKGYKRK